MSRHGMSFLDDGIGLPSITKSKISYLKRKNRKLKENLGASIDQNGDSIMSRMPTAFDSSH
jgi:hypothetical protein